MRIAQGRPTVLTTVWATALLLCAVPPSSHAAYWTYRLWEGAPQMSLSFLVILHAMLVLVAFLGFIPARRLYRLLRDVLGRAAVIEVVDDILSVRSSTGILQTHTTQLAGVIKVGSAFPFMVRDLVSVRTTAGAEFARLDPWIYGLNATTLRDRLNILVDKADEDALDNLGQGPRSLRADVVGKSVAWTARLAAILISIICLAMLARSFSHGYQLTNSGSPICRGYPEDCMNMYRSRQ